MGSERYITRHKIPEGRVRELLVVLQEEAAEVTVAVAKALRFGLADGYPGRPETNAQDIAREVGDFMAVMKLLMERDVFSEDEVVAAAAAKKSKLLKFLQTEEDADA